MSRPRSTAGFTLLDMLVAIGIVALLMVAMTNAMSGQNRTMMSAELATAREDNLRMALGRVVEHLKQARAGAPRSLLTRWYPWVTDFTTNPRIIDGGSLPDTILVAGCFRGVAYGTDSNGSSVVRLQSGVGAGATTLRFTEPIATVFNATNKRVLVIDGREPAFVTSAVGSDVQINTQPGRTPARGTVRGYPANTPVCRADVFRYSIQNGALTLSDHTGGEPVIVADGIIDLQVTTLGDQRYSVEVRAQTGKRDPLTGAFASVSTRSNVTLRNAK